MFQCGVSRCVLILICLFLGCTKPGPTVHPHGPASSEPILLHASGACLARIVKLEEQDDRPSDGDHRIEARLEIEESSGTVPEILQLVIGHGGHMPIEVFQKLEAQMASMLLRHDSLKVGELHWFVFSDDYDSTKYPYKVAGWWRYSDGDVPADVVQAVKEDRFADHPVWDGTLNAVYSWTQIGDDLRIRVRQADSLDEDKILFDKTLKGKYESLSLSHWAVPYEMEWPEGQEGHFVKLATVSELPDDNEFDLPAGRYRIMYAFELYTGKKVAVWVAENQEVWLMHAFRQYDPETGIPTIVMDFDLLTTGGIAAGSDTEEWYRRTVKKFQDGDMQSEQIFRHPYIKHGTEPVYSGSGWVSVEEPESRGN